MTDPHDPTIERIQLWAARRDDVLAVLLTSTRAVPGARVDALSDYDVILIVDHVRHWAMDRAWVAAFGQELVSWWDPVAPNPKLSVETGGGVIYYTDGLKIDVTLWPPAAIAGMVQRSVLIPELDAGYQVLHDRNGITAALPDPSHTAYRSEPPDSATWDDTVSGFLVGAPYVAKCLVRGDLLPTRWCLDVDMIHTYLVPMLRWHVGINHGWSRPAGNLGKGLQRELPADLWAEVEAIWTGSHEDALFRTMAVFQRVGVEVGDRLEMPYPVAQHDGVETLARSTLDNSLAGGLSQA